MKPRAISVLTFDAQALLAASSVRAPADHAVGELRPCLSSSSLPVGTGRKHCSAARARCRPTLLARSLARVGHTQLGLEGNVVEQHLRRQCASATRAQRWSASPKANSRAAKRLLELRHLAAARDIDGDAPTRKRLSSGFKTLAIFAHLRSAEASLEWLDVERSRVETSSEEAGSSAKPVHLSVLWKEVISAPAAHAFKRLSQCSSPPSLPTVMDWTASTPAVPVGRGASERRPRSWGPKSTCDRVPPPLERCRLPTCATRVYWLDSPSFRCLGWNPTVA